MNFSQTQMMRALVLAATLTAASISTVRATEVDLGASDWDNSGVSNLGWGCKYLANPFIDVELEGYVTSDPCYGWIREFDPFTIGPFSIVVNYSNLGEVTCLTGGQPTTYRQSYSIVIDGVYPGLKSGLSPSGSDPWSFEWPGPNNNWDFAYPGLRDIQVTLAPGNPSGTECSPPSPYNYKAGAVKKRFFNVRADIASENGYVYSTTPWQGDSLLEENVGQNTLEVGSSESLSTQVHGLLGGNYPSGCIYQIAQVGGDAEVSLTRSSLPYSMGTQIPPADHTDFEITAVSPGTAMLELTFSWGGMTTTDRVLYTILPTAYGGGVGGDNGLQECPKACKSEKDDGGVDADPVYLHSGEFFLEETDLTIPGRGIDFVWSRKYRSQLPRTSDLGEGWDFSYNIYLEAEADGDLVLHGGDGRIDTYRKQWNGTWSKNGFAREIRLISGTTYSMAAEGRTTWNFRALDSPVAQGRISSIVDSNGNALTFLYNATGQLSTIIDTMGRPITVDYSTASGKIQYVTDFTGRRVTYEHYLANGADGRIGDLKSVTSPSVTGTPNGNDFPDGKTVTYTYYATDGSPAALYHNLLTITDAKGQLYLTNIYGTAPGSATTFDRVIQQVWGEVGANPSSQTIDKYCLHYVHSLPTSGNQFERIKTIVNDRMGNVREYHFNLFNELIKKVEYTGRATPGADVTAPPNPNTKLRAGDPDSFTTTYKRNVDHRLTQITYPNGNITEYAYEAELAGTNNRPSPLVRGDLRTVTRKPGTHTPAGNQTTITESYTYDGVGGCSSCGTRLPKTYTDGEGNVTTYTYDENGNRTSASHPPVTLRTGSNQAAIEGDAVQDIVESWTYNENNGQLHTHTDPEGNVTEYEYYPETDPNGDGTVDNANGDPVTGGYLKMVTVDKYSVAGRNSGTNPTPVSIRTQYKYDAVGNQTRVIDGRGVATDFSVNKLNQVVQITRAAEHGIYTALDPPEPGSLENFQHVERTFYDANNNVVLEQVEDRGNTSNVDGNLPAADLLAVGVTDPDPVGGTAFVDTLYKYDILNNRIEEVRELNQTSPGTFVRTLYRYDRNRNPVLTVFPEGNAVSQVFDERDLPFQSTSGTSTRPAAGIYFTGDPTTFNSPGGAGTVASTTTTNYDGNGNPIEAVDAVNDGGTASTIAGVGDATRTTYDGYDRPVIVTDPLGNTTSYTYDADSRVVRTIQRGAPSNDQPGDTGNVTLAVTEALYDEMGRQTTTHQVLFETPGVTPQRTPILTDTAAMDGLVEYLSDAASDTASVPGVTDITVLGRISTVTEYDRKGRATFTVSDDMKVARRFHDGADRTIKTVDGALDNGFDAPSGAFDPSTLAGNASESAYDDNGNRIEEKRTEVSSVADVGAEEFRTTNQYDSLNRLVTTVDSAGRANDLRYDSRGNLVARADAVGPVSSRSIQRRGLGSSASVTINDFGNVTRQVYDGLGRKVEDETLLSATGQGNGTYVGATTEGVKSDPPTGYLDSTEAGDGRISVYLAYDDNGRLLAQRDDNGNTTAHIYDNQDRELVERKGLNVSGASFSITDGDDAAFNVALRGGESVVDTESAGTDITVDYDVDGRPVTRVDEAGNEITLSHDALNRRVSNSITVATGFVGTTLQTWQYDGLGRQSRSSDNNNAGTADDVVCSYIYDSLSRLLEQTQKLGALDARAISTHYDVAAAASTHQPSTQVYPDSRRVDSTYDGLGRLVARRDNGQTSDIGRYAYIGRARVATLTYQNNTRLTHIFQSGGQNADLGFDSLRRIVNHRWEAFTPGTPPLGNGTLIVGFEHQSGGTSLQPLYDRASNKLIEFKTHDPGNSERYRYDSAYRLTIPGSDSGTLPADAAFQRGTFTDSTRSAMTTGQQYQQWLLDGLGNWNGFYDNNPTVQARTHSDFNEIVTLGGVTQTDDLNGNLTDDGSALTLKWDALNRLREAYRRSDSALVAVYLYDAGGRRIRKTVSNGGVDDDSSLNGVTDFYYSGWRVLEEREPDLELETDAVIRQYTYGNYLDEVWTVDKREGGITVAQLNDGSGSERLFSHANTLYSVCGLTDEAGVLVEAYQYDPYGSHLRISDGQDGDSAVNFTTDDIRTAGVPSGFGAPQSFTGQRLDPETGLLYYRSRYYSARMGRFVSRDVIGVWTDVGNMGNGYAYVGNDPVGRVDPKGRRVIYIGVSGGFTLLGGGGGYNVGFAHDTLNEEFASYITFQWGFCPSIPFASFSPYSLDFGFSNVTNFDEWSGWGSYYGGGGGAGATLQVGYTRSSGHGGLDFQVGPGAGVSLSAQKSYCILRGRRSTRLDSCPVWRSKLPSGSYSAGGVRAEDDIYGGTLLLRDPAHGW